MDHAVELDLLMVIFKYSNNKRLNFKYLRFKYSEEISQVALIKREYWMTPLF